MIDRLASIAPDLAAADRGVEHPQPAFRPASATRTETSGRIELMSM